MGIEGKSDACLTPDPTGPPDPDDPEPNPSKPESDPFSGNLQAGNRPFPGPGEPPTPGGGSPNPTPGVGSKAPIS